MSLFGTALGPVGKGPSPCAHPAWDGGTSRLAAGHGMGIPSAGRNGKTKNRNKNKPQVSATFPCNRPNEETAGDGQAGCVSQGGKATGTQLCGTAGSSSGLQWEMDGQEEGRFLQKAGVSLRVGL